MGTDTLLKNTITVDISRADTTNSCTIYESDVLGLIQNDPRYAEKVNSADGIPTMPRNTWSTSS